MKVLGVRIIFSAVCFMLLFVNSLQPSLFESDSQTNVVLDVRERLVLDRKFLNPSITFVLVQVPEQESIVHIFSSSQ